MVERVGDSRPIPAGMRIISATHREPSRLIETGAFRDDFYYRINVIPIRMLPLRERRVEIPRLAESFLPRVQGISCTGVRSQTGQLLRHAQRRPRGTLLAKRFRALFVSELKPSPAVGWEDGGQGNRAPRLERQGIFDREELGMFSD